MKSVLSILVIGLSVTLGVLTAWSGATPQNLSHPGEMLGGACANCSGVNPATTCARKWGGGCTSESQFSTCYSDSPDSGTCQGVTVNCSYQADCGRPNDEMCNSV
jgi:hypothetical protein